METAVSAPSPMMKEEKSRSLTGPASDEGRPASPAPATEAAAT
jgi:small subunit ribosomal protein S6